MNMRHTDELKPTGDICVCECNNASWYYEKAKKNEYPIRGELWVCEGGGEYGIIKTQSSGG